MRDARVTPILHGAAVTSPRVRRLLPSGLLLLAALAGCGTSGSPAPRHGDGAGPLDPAVPAAAGGASGAPGADASVRAAEKSPAVTHLGRTVLPRAGLVVLGRSVGRSEVPPGIEVVRFQVDEVLRSMPWDRPPDDVEHPVLTVLSGEPGMLPAPGAAAVLLVAHRPRSPNYDVVQVVAIDDRAGPQRLAALRRYLEIEAYPDEEERVSALLSYLREAVRGPDLWTRSNAALEYGSLARARPDDLRAEDAPLLRAAAQRAGEADVRAALESALAVAERAAARTARATPDARSDAAARSLDELSTRFADASDAAVRRGVVLEAAVTHRAAASTLLRRATADADERVREAAVAAAGQLRITDLAEDVARVLANDTSAHVRRSAVRAAGFLRSTAAVPQLALLARAETELGDDACFALARVRDDAGLAALSSLRADAAPSRRELLDFLLSDAFAAQEEQLGRPLR